MSKLLWKNKFISVYETEHHFFYTERRNVNSTATLCFKKVGNKYLFLVRYQPLPVVHGLCKYEWNHLFACPITGSMEKGQQPLDNAINEVYEEGNIIVTKKNLVAHSFNVASTQMNETVYNYLFDVTKAKTVNKQQGDGTVFESHSQNKWLTYEQLKKIVHNDKKQYYLSSLLSCLSLFEDKYGKTKNKR